MDKRIIKLYRKISINTCILCCAIMFFFSFFTKNKLEQPIGIIPNSLTLKTQFIKNEPYLSNYQRGR